MTSTRRNELLPEALNFMIWFVIPCDFENKRLFENFFALIMEGIDTLWIFKFGMSQIIATLRQP